MLPSLIRPDSDNAAEEDTADILTSALGSMFPDDTQIMHGDPGSGVVYSSRAFGDVRLRLADPVGEDGRKLFAHYLWNSSVWLAEVMGEAVRRKPGWKSDGRDGKECGKGDEEHWREGYERGRTGRRAWSVEGERVLELGAGTGLAGIIALACGASEVVTTDYPDPQVLASIATNIEKNKSLWTSAAGGSVSDSTSTSPASVPTLQDPTKPDLKGTTDQPTTNPSKSVSTRSISSTGHTWGDLTSSFSVSKAHHFTRVLAADTLWLGAQHANLAASMEHFLSFEKGAQVWLVAGFHTGRQRVKGFFEELEAQGKLEVEERWEVDVGLREREWVDGSAGEGSSDRKRWLMVAVLRRRRG